MHSLGSRILHSGNLQSPATDFGGGDALTGILQSGILQSPPTDFGAGDVTDVTVMYLYRLSLYSTIWLLRIVSSKSPSNNLLRIVFRIVSFGTSIKWERPLDIRKRPLDIRTRRGEVGTRRPEADILGGVGGGAPHKGWF